MINREQNEKWPPLVKGLLDYANQNYYGWHIPGHHFGRSAFKQWKEFLGENDDRNTKVENNEVHRFA